MSCDHGTCKVGLRSGAGQINVHGKSNPVKACVTEYSSHLLTNIMSPGVEGGGHKTLLAGQL